MNNNTTSRTSLLLLIAIELNELAKNRILVLRSYPGSRVSDLHSEEPHMNHPSLKSDCSELKVHDIYHCYLVTLRLCRLRLHAAHFDVDVATRRSELHLNTTLTIPYWMGVERVTALVIRLRIT